MGCPGVVITTGHILFFYTYKTSASYYLSFENYLLLHRKYLFNLYFWHKSYGMDDKEISIEKINKLDAITFRLLYKKYYRALVGYAMQVTGEAGAAEDIVQELFSVVWERRIPFQSIAIFKVYLYNSTRNASLDYLRHKNVESDYLQKVEETYRTYELEEEDGDDFFDEEIYRKLFKTIDELPERCREVFLMHMEGKKNEEIANALHISLETVKTQKKRAMSFLRKKLGSTNVLLLLSLLS